MDRQTTSWHRRGRSSKARKNVHFFFAVFSRSSNKSCFFFFLKRNSLKLQLQSIFFFETLWHRQKSMSTTFPKLIFLEFLFAWPMRQKCLFLNNIAIDKVWEMPWPHWNPLWKKNRADSRTGMNFCLFFPLELFQSSIFVHKNDTAVWIIFTIRSFYPVTKLHILRLAKNKIKNKNKNTSVLSPLVAFPAIFHNTWGNPNI